MLKDHHSPPWNCVASTKALCLARVPCPCTDTGHAKPGKAMAIISVPLEKTVLSHENRALVRRPFYTP